MWQGAPQSEAAGGSWDLDNPSGKGGEREKWMEVKNSLFASLRMPWGNKAGVLPLEACGPQWKIVTLQLKPDTAKI